MRYIPNEVAITTQSVLDGMRITHAYYHSTDGIWEFFPDQEWDYDDLRLVAMEEIVNKDYRLLDRFFAKLAFFIIICNMVGVTPI